MFLIPLYLLVVITMRSAVAFHVLKPTSGLSKAHRFRRLDIQMSRKKGNGLVKNLNKHGIRPDIPAMFVGDHEELEPPEDDEDIYQDSPQIGSQVTGRVIAIYDDGALVAIHGKESAFLPIDEAGLKEINDMHDVVEVDELIKAEMIGSYKGRAIISLRNARLIEAWNKVTTMRAANEAFEVQVLEVNRGGATVEAIDGLVGFLPVSHYANGGKLMDETLIGTTLTVKILETVESEGKLVVSQRLAVASPVSQKRGTLVSGVVTGIRDYGVFFDLVNGNNNTPALLHVSQVSAERATNLQALFTVGETLQVVVMDHDMATGRIALSTKCLEISPGDMLRDKAGVQANASANLERFHAKVTAERAAREVAAQDFVASLTAAMAGAAEAVQYADQLPSRQLLRQQKEEGAGGQGATDDSGSRPQLSAENTATTAAAGTTPATAAAAPVPTTLRPTPRSARGAATSAGSGTVEFDAESMQKLFAEARAAAMEAKNNKMKRE